MRRMTQQTQKQLFLFQLFPLFYSFLTPLEVVDEKLLPRSFSNGTSPSSMFMSLWFSLKKIKETLKKRSLNFTQSAPFPEHHIALPRIFNLKSHQTRVFSVLFSIPIVPLHVVAVSLCGIWCDMGKLFQLFLWWDSPWIKFCRFERPCRWHEGFKAYEIVNEAVDMLTNAKHSSHFFLRSDRDRTHSRSRCLLWETIEAHSDESMALQT